MAVEILYLKTQGAQVGLDLETYVSIETFFGKWVSKRSQTSYSKYRNYILAFSELF